MIYTETFSEIPVGDVTGTRLFGFRFQMSISERNGNSKKGVTFSCLAGSIYTSAFSFQLTLSYFN